MWKIINFIFDLTHIGSYAIRRVVILTGKRNFFCFKMIHKLRVMLKSLRINIYINSN